MRFISLFIVSVILLFSVNAIAETPGVPPGDGNTLVSQVVSMEPLTDEAWNSVPIVLTAALTDAAPSYNTVVLTRDIKDLYGYLLIDKGATLNVYPLPIDQFATKAKASDTVTIADGG
jgi:hypothetical protein